MNRYFKRIIALLLASFSMVCHASDGDYVKSIIMGGHYQESSDEYKHVKRMPISPIYTSQIQHTFIFDIKYSGDIIVISDNNMLLYKGIIDEEGEVNIPNLISGKFHLCLLHDNISYSAIVEL